MHFLLLLNMWHFTLKFLSNFSRNLICIIHILSKYNFMISHCLIYPSPWLGSASHYICYLSARYTGEERGRTHIWPENSIYRSKCFSGISCSRISLISQYITFVLRKFTWLILVNVNTFVHFLIFFFFHARRNNYYYLLIFRKYVRPVSCLIFRLTLSVLLFLSRNSSNFIKFKMGQGWWVKSYFST